MLFGLSVQWNTCFYMFDFISITCIFDPLCSQINDDEKPRPRWRQSPVWTRLKVAFTLTRVRVRLPMCGLRVCMYSHVDKATALGLVLYKTVDNVNGLRSISIRPI